MKTWIALLRAVNVGGHNKLPMAEFRALLGDLGFENVATYIQSGNAVFRAAERALEIADAIGASVRETFGFDVDVLVQSLEDLRAAVAANPFPQAEDAPKSLHLFFFSQPLESPDLKAMNRLAANGEEFLITKNVLYLHAPNGIGRSAQGANFGRFIKTPMTGRNLRSCHKSIELAQAV